MWVVLGSLGLFLDKPYRSRGSGIFRAYVTGCSRDFLGVWDRPGEAFD